MIYLDNNATTQIADPVFEAMLPYLKSNFGNASSIQHRLGREASHAVENARKTIADILHCETKEVFFTSGSTESINTVLKGVAERYRNKGKHIVTCTTEHKAVLSTFAYLEKVGYHITYLPVDAQGHVDMDQLDHEITDETILVCLSWANNETGVLHPIEAIADLCKSRDVLLFCDATQYIGKMPLPDLQKVPIDMLCFSAHKIHGPKGVGALYIRRKRRPIQIEPLIVGGNQEQGWRGGTYNVPGIVGLGVALAEVLLTDLKTIASLRDWFEQQMIESVEEITVNGDIQRRIVNTSNLTLKHIKSQELMSKLHDIAISSGSACVTGTRDPSHVLKAMGLSDDDAYCAIRISLSRFTTMEELKVALAKIKQAAEEIRSKSPIWQLYKSGIL